jgi:hypothetical protein
MKLYQRIIAGGFVVAGLAGLVGYKDKVPIENPAQVPNIRYEQSIPYSPIAGGGYSAGGDVASGDINGDGFNDLIVADVRKITRYLNNGAGKFTDPKLIANPAAIAGGGYSDNITITLSDIDNDKDLDLIIADTKGIAIFYNDGKGNFSQ